MINIIMVFLASLFIIGCSGTQVASHYNGDKYSSGAKFRTNILSW